MKKTIKTIEFLWEETTIIAAERLSWSQIRSSEESATVISEEEHATVLAGSRATVEVPLNGKNAGGGS